MFDVRGGTLGSTMVSRTGKVPPLGLSSTTGKRLSHTSLLCLMLCWLLLQTLDKQMHLQSIKGLLVFGLALATMGW